jgi:glucose/arabinose dehydrogenase
MQFEENRGQVDPEVRFLSRGRGYQLFLTDSEAVLVLPDRNRPHEQTPGMERDPTGVVGATLEPDSRAGGRRVLRFRLTGAGTPASIHGSRALPTRIDYLRGRDPSKWHRGVPVFARVEYEKIVPGVDLVYYGDRGCLEYDLVVAPGADPSSLAIEFQGAEQVTLRDDGAVVASVETGNVVLHPPTVYQEVGGRREPVSGNWAMSADGRLGFAVGPYDESQALIIDPTVEFSTYLGGSGSEDALDNMGVALDSDGNIYIAGTTDSADFPTLGGAQNHFSGTTDVFVAKLDARGTKTLYATYLGGQGLDSGQAIAVDADGNAYVGGFTNSNDFPTVAPFQGTIGGSFDGFVAKLDPSGSSLVYSTYIGGSQRDFVLGIDVDDVGQAYVAGDVESEDFPTVNPLQPRWGGVWDAWAAKLTPAGDGLVFSTYLGGSYLDAGLDIKVDRSGFVYVAGFTISSDFPTRNAFQETRAGDVDAYVVKLSPDGSAFVYSTYLGGGNADRAIGIDVDRFGNAYVVGDTLSVDFPAVHPILEFNGFADAVLAKLDAAGGVVFTTFLGGAVADQGLAVAVDPSGNAHITGMTFSDPFPLVRPLQQRIGGDVDAFVASVDASGAQFTFSSYLGGSGGDRGLAIAADAAGNIVVVGDTDSSDFPTLKPIQPELDGTRDIFVTKVSNSMDIIKDPSIQIEQIVAGLLAPRAMVFIGDGDLLVLENRGWIRRVRNGALEPDPVVQLPVDGNKPGRPYELAVEPDFPSKPFVYTYFTEVNGAGEEPVGQRLYRYTWSGGMLQSPELLLDIPPGPDPDSSAGTIAFGPDGKLYLSSADTGNDGELQNMTGGGAPDDSSVVMRLEPDGTVPSDNPFFSLGGNRSKYFGYGIHVVTALAFDPVTANLWAADAGVDQYDEIDLVPPGFNGGWSQLSGPSARRAGGIPNLVEYPGSTYREPVFSWKAPVLPSAMVFLDTDKVGDHYRNHLFVGSAIDGNLYHFAPNLTREGLRFIGTGMSDLVADDDVEASESLFGVGFGSISDLKVGPDGFLYVLSSALGGVYRVYWESDVELKLSGSRTAVPQGGTLPVTLSIENRTSEQQEIALLLSIRLPNGYEFPVVGPLQVSLPPSASGTVELPLSLPAGAELGVWTFKGLIARPFSVQPEIVDLSEVVFEVTPAATWSP